MRSITYSGITPQTITGVAGKRIMIRGLSIGGGAGLVTIAPAGGTTMSVYSGTAPVFARPSTREPPILIGEDGGDVVITGVSLSVGTLWYTIESVMGSVS